MTRFPGKVALISAAGAGIGRATAMIIAREGGTVVGVDLETALLEQLAADVVAAGGRALGIRADALDAASVDRAVRQAVDACGRIDILVNGVGGSTVVSRPAALLDELTL
jgi:NAD(P)-dependent dehydrogenase (short-subunit alcohol dehydrogenase family)